MKKIFVFAALAGSAVLAGCASPQHGAIPVVDSGTPVSNQESGGSASPVPRYRVPSKAPPPRAFPRAATPVWW